jgi:hypothetical protein
MRNMAWERAKGELNSILQTYWSKVDGEFEPISKVIEDFIKNVEDHGLSE